MGSVAKALQGRHREPRAASTARSDGAHAARHPLPAHNNSERRLLRPPAKETGSAAGRPRLRRGLHRRALIIYQRRLLRLRRRRRRAEALAQEEGAKGGGEAEGGGTGGWASWAAIDRWLFCKTFSFSVSK